MSAHAIHWQTWDLADEADRRFRRWCFIIGVPLLLIGVLVPLLDLVGLTRGGGTLSGQRYVEFLPEQEAPVAEKVEEPAPAEEEQPEPPQEVKSEPTPKPKPEPAPEPQPVVDQQQVMQQARQVASRSGVMAFADQLADLRDSSLPGIDTQQALSSVVSARGGSGSGSGSARAAESIAQSASASSGGIQSDGTGQVRRTQSGTGLGQRRTTVVESPVGFGEDRTRPGQGGDKLIAGRTLEEIQLTFDRNKGAFYAIFNRAMRDNPNLGAGKIVVSLTISPDGSVTNVTLVSSSFHDPELERKVLQRVQLLNFGAKAVPPFTYPNYPINFLPS